MTLGRRYISTLYADADIVFPLPTAWRHYFSRVKHHLYWIPDFQEHYLPAFFKTEEIQARKVDQQLILQFGQHIVFSSHAAQSDFSAIYPASTLKQHILQFAVTSRAAPEQASAFLAQYGIAQPYFMCSNQFWKHKNHPTVLRALAELRQNYPQALVVFTGKEHDYRNPTYFEELAALRQELDLDKHVRFLGFIPRADQLTLMQASLAVLQPSLFEGWSTVVEDAKSLNAPVIASSIAVHTEQLASYDAKLFFAPESASQLAACMAQALDGGLTAQPYDYQMDVMRFGREFRNIIETIAVT
jgi:glycosyltransferase involved in cell wall biosynthesis